MKKVLTSLIMTICVIIGIGAISAQAEVYSGSCGDNVTYTLDKDTGILTLLGTGQMKNFLSNDAPWYNDRGYIKNVVIEAGVTNIGKGAFKDCVLMETIQIPDSVANIEDMAFFECSCLKNIMIPSTVKSIGKYAFNGCDNLTSIIISDGVLDIGTSAFEGCNSLTSVQIPNSVTSLGMSAFRQCKNLIDVDLPDNIETIEKYTFYGCIQLSDVNIPESVTCIGDWAFSNCDGLTSITIGKSVSMIGDDAFSSCNNLMRVNFHDSVKIIGAEAFSYCYNITDVYYEGSEADWGNITINSNNEYLTNATIHYGIENFITYIFITNGGTTVSPITGELLEEPVTTREGFEFIGWYDNEALTGEKVSFPYFGEATTLYARWWYANEEIRGMEYKINSITLRDILTNTAISAIPDTGFVAEINVTNVSSEKADIIIIAAYDENETLLDMDFVYADVEIGEDVTFGSFVSNSEGNVHSVKAFVRPRLNSLVPLAESKEIEKRNKEVVIAR